MQNGDFVAENLMQVGCDGGRKADLRDEQDGGTSGFENRTHARQIHGRLARASHAVQKNSGKLAPFNGFAQAVECALLRRVEIEFKRRTRLATRYGKSRGFFDDFNQTSPREGAERSSWDVERLQYFYGNTASGGSQCVRNFPLIIVELALGGFQDRHLDCAGGIAYGGNIFAH